MAARRLAASSINWAAFAERVPENQRPNFLALKARTDNYLRRVNANPAEPPKIDWAMYKSKVNVPGLVDTFKKQYEALQVPYPADTVTPKINEQEKLAASETSRFIAESNQRIKDYEARIAKWATVLPYEEMTLEDFYDAHPDKAIDVNKPTFWPHDAEEQPGYVEPGAVVADSKH
jgi:F-type H+-transporting ATPase subunit d